MDLPTVRTLDEIVRLVERDGDGLDVRWSQGPETDLCGDSTGTSRDVLAGIELPGMSASPLRVEDWWGERPLDRWVARRLYDDRHLSDLRGPGVRAWLLHGREGSRGPERAPRAGGRPAGRRRDVRPAR